MIVQMKPEKRGIYARIPFRKLQASFQKPEISEGFIEVIDVDFEVSNHVQLPCYFWLRIS